jgi:RimJ/RimL family protein N-acetyltransferase
MTAINDSSQARAIFAKDRTWSAYALADLSPEFVAHCEWHVPVDTTDAVLLLYRAFERPILIAFGDASAVEGLVNTIAEPSLFVNVRPEIVPIFKARYAECHVRAMWRMVLDLSRYRPVPSEQAVRLGTEDTEMLMRLYADGEIMGESPDFFSPSMLSQGVYFGVFEDAEMIAVAGTHVVTPDEGVAAIGYVYTRRDRRGRGHAATVTSAVTKDLLRMKLPTIVLNVNQQNKAAIQVYERLGYVRYCAFYEGLAKRLREPSSPR